ncbi:MAG: RsmG family class I SAM-dependent methyltransferase [Polyangiales bacterium]|nr:class I SAM-dependent methyltransferase [Myxococcales bacterium]MCB9657274.1 class I SAM-dependent methyltransferase [Sandaracinaceae bacterium]
MDQVRALAERLDIPLTDAAGERLSAFLALTSLWGKRIDLTSARDDAALAEILFVDALHMVSETLVPRGARVLDVGAGVGAPTLPMLLLRDDLRALLVEPRRKRVAFLRTAVGSLGLASRVQVVEAKLDLAHPTALTDAHGSVDVALARATFSPPVWLGLGRQLAPRTLVLTAQEAPPEGALTAVSYAVPSNGAKRVVSAYASG